MNKGMHNWLRRLNDRQMQVLSAAMDAEIDRRADRQIGRGYVRTTYLHDRVRGKRQAPRVEKESLAA